jgi:hypothetical protein
MRDELSDLIAKVWQRREVTQLATALRWFGVGRLSLPAALAIWLVGLRQRR